MNRFMTATCITCNAQCDARSKSQRCQSCRDYATQPAHVRVMAKVVIDDNGCWLFCGAENGYGYGQIRVVDSGRSHLVPSHRVMYEHHVGPIGPGMQIDHLCRVRRCVNPAHLEPVTQQENIRRGDASMPRKIRPCLICEKLFTGRPWAITCSPGCRSEAGRRAALKRYQDVS